MSEPVLIEFDPEGSWRSKRYELCNALEAAIDSNDGYSWSVLKDMGVYKIEHVAADVSANPRKSNKMQEG
jgi:hypothetical protein